VAGCLRAGEQYPACPVVWPSTRSRGALVVKPRWAIAKGPTLQVLTWRQSKCPELCVRRPQTFQTNPVEDVPFRGLCEDGRTFLLFFLSKQEGDLELFFFRQGESYFRLRTSTDCVLEIKFIYFVRAGSREDGLSRVVRQLSREARA
jgi:hypothetical protein